MGKVVTKLNVKCCICNKEESINPCRAKNYKTCSVSCRTTLSQLNLTKKLNKTCPVCNNDFLVKPSQYKRRECCSTVCSNKLKETIYLGVKNPNCKYKNVDHDFFKTVDTEFKAYLLGWIVSDGYVSKVNNVVIKIRDYDYNLLKTLKNGISNELSITHVEENMIALTINSKTWVEDICKLIKINPGKKSDIVQQPTLDNEELQ